MKYDYITIEREYGSGGTVIARRLAEECGVPVYGREILEMISNEVKIPIEKIDKYEETVTKGFIYSLFVISKLQEGKTDLITNEGQIYFAEQKIIKRLASQGRAIFLGHCASEALKERSGVLKVFIKSGQEYKIQRAIEDYGIPYAEAETTMKRFDKKRANYFRANTSKKWNDPDNYDLVLDSGKLGVDGCVAALKGLLIQNC